jgi:hypothetical protein
MSEGYGTVNININDDTNTTETNWATIDFCNNITYPIRVVICLSLALFIVGLYFGSVYMGNAIGLCSFNPESYRENCYITGIMLFFITLFLMIYIPVRTIQLVIGFRECCKKECKT